ncbi:hypothetical protein ABE444_07775 [Brevundimonas pondensis]|uniref:hypothetical protein n=1 Tax=Brevundimonas pondensis TaxID=2774189 RepID=UPI00320B4963
MTAWLMATMMLAADPGADAAAKAARAETCLAQIESLIVEASQETGRVAGPSWFIRDWWIARLPEAGQPGALSEAARRQAVADAPDRKEADPQAFAEERRSCITEAIDAGAVPGMGG